MPVYETSVTLDCPQERAFEFLLRPANIARISPPELGLAFTKAPEVLDLGSEFEFKVQAYGQVLTMIHEITELVPPAPDHRNAGQRLFRTVGSTRTRSRPMTRGR